MGHDEAGTSAPASRRKAVGLALPGGTGAGAARREGLAVVERALRVAGGRDAVGLRVETVGEVGRGTIEGCLLSPLIVGPREVGGRGAGRPEPPGRGVTGARGW